MLGQYEKMVNVASSSIVARQDCSNNFILKLSDEAHPGVALEITKYSLFLIARPKANSSVTLPDINQHRVIRHAHFGDGYAHFLAPR